MKTITLTNPTDNQALSGLAFDAPVKPKAVIALVHGFGEHGGRYVPMAAAFKEKDIAVVSVDLHGHGHTEGKRGVSHTYNALMSDVNAIIDKTKSLYPDVPLFLFGHSMGGGLVLNNVLRRRPEGLAGVISSAPLIKPADPFPGFQRFMLRVMRKLMPNFTANAGLDSAGISTIQAEVDKYNNDPLVHGKMGAGLAIDVMAGGEWLLEYANVWYETVPLLLYHSKEDTLTDFSASEEFGRLAPGCEFYAYENVGHEMHNDTSREDVFKMIDNFISRHI